MLIMQGLLRIEDLLLHTKPFLEKFGFKKEKKTNIVSRSCTDADWKYFIAQGVLSLKKS